MSFHLHFCHSSLCAVSPSLCVCVFRERTRREKEPNPLLETKLLKKNTPKKTNRGHGLIDDDSPQFRKVPCETTTIYEKKTSRRTKYKSSHIKKTPQRTKNDVTVHTDGVLSAQVRRRAVLCGGPLVVLRELQQNQPN